MNGLRNGRWLGLTWCCTVDTNGAEHDLAFGWTHRASTETMHAQIPPPHDDNRAGSLTLGTDPTL